MEKIKKKYVCIDFDQFEWICATFVVFFLIGNFYSVLLGIVLSLITLLINSSVQCVGGLTTSKGKFNDETGICKYLFSSGDTAFTKYKGSGEVGKSGSGTFEFIGGTGKYKSISGSGTVTRITIQAAKKVSHRVRIYLKEVINLTRLYFYNFF